MPGHALALLLQCLACFEGSDCEHEDEAWTLSLILLSCKEWARFEWSIWTLKTVCPMLRKHVGIRDFLSIAETGFRDHRNPGAAILWVEASFVYDGWMSGIEQLCAIDTPQGGSMKFSQTTNKHVAVESQRFFMVLCAFQLMAWRLGLTRSLRKKNLRFRSSVEPGSRVIRIARRHDTNDSNQSFNGERASIALICNCRETCTILYFHVTKPGTSSSDSCWFLIEVHICNNSAAAYFNIFQYWHLYW